MATKIKLMRLGKMREPHYRIVVADARTKRDGRAIETIGEYHPKKDPSVIEVDADRARYWLGVGAQPTEAVTAIFRVTGDWQKFKGQPAPEPMKVAAPKPDSAPSTRPPSAPATASRRPTQPPPRRRPPRRRPPTRRPPPRPLAERPAAEARRGRPGRRREAPDRRARDALEHLVKGIVDHPDDVRVDMVDNRRGQRLEIRVHPDDLGSVIGRGGRPPRRCAR